MSAIFGIIDKRNLLINPANIETMAQKLRHHSIDGQKVFVQAGIMLGYHKLVLHSAEKNSIMPFVSEDYVVVADARIDNRNQLAKILALTQKLDDLSDGQIIVEAFKKWGESSVDYLEGEFCFLIYHTISRSFFAASDHIGHRSFYYFDAPECFIFASEIKAVLAVKPPPHSFNDEFIVKCFTRNYNGNTHIKGIQALKGGHSLVCNSEKGLSIKKYWTPRVTGKYKFQTLSQWGECLRELMTEAIENRISINQPIGIKLSGGLDSSFIAGILSRTLIRKNKSFTALSSVLSEGDPHKLNDESYYIKLLGKHLPNMEQVFITPEKQVGPFDKLPELFEESDGAINPFHYLDTAILQAAKERNIRLLFNGYGGDHAISNARRSYIYESARRLQFREVIRVLKLLRKAYGHSIIRLIKSDLLNSIPLYVSLKKVIKTKADEDINYFNSTIEKRISAIERVQLTNQKNVLIEAMNAGNLGREHQEVYYRDAHFGLRKTTPFFDKKILEFYLDVPEKVLFDNGFRRGLIREAMSGLVPDEIVWRKIKKAYSPDFSDRIGSLECWKNQLLSAPEYAFVRPYMNQKNLRVHLSNGDIYATMTVLVFIFIQSLKDQQILSPEF